MSKDMSIEGVFHHVQAIIAQDRIQEYLDACQSQGFVKISGPDGLIAFTREFIGVLSPADPMPDFRGIDSERFKAHIDKSLKTPKSYLDECTS